MKSKLTILSIFFLGLMLVQTNLSFGQYERPRTAENPNEKRANTFISVGSGVNYKYGAIGIGVGMMIGENVLGELTLGLGGYGFKSGVNLVFNAGANKKWRPTLGFARASGLQDFETEVEVVFNSNTVKTNAPIDMPAAFVLTPGFQRIFKFRNGSSFAIDLGVGISLNNFKPSFSEDAIKLEGFIVPSNQVSFSNSQETFFNVMGPSGLCLGLSYNFGLGLK